MLGKYPHQPGEYFLSFYKYVLKNKYNSPYILFVIENDLFFIN